MVQDIHSLRVGYPAIAPLLDEILAQTQAVLGEKLVGLYLFGSLVVGDFDAISDLDLLVAISSDLDDAEFAALDKMHGAIVGAHPEWNDRIELLYLSVTGLQTFKTARSPIAVISPGEPFNRTDAGKDWLLNWFLVREKGLKLFGVPPQTLIPPISQAEYVEVVREQAAVWLDRIDEPLDRPGQAYAILTLCRALYAVTYGEHVSKLKAATWAAQVMPEWAATIQRAWSWRQHSQEKVADHTATLDETRRFVRHVSKKILEQPAL